mgnify:CR=1 FL=1
MDNTFSKSWINMRVEYDETSRSSALVDYLNKIPKKHEVDLVDFCCGTGSFLMWALNKNISFQNCILVDYDIKLLKSIKSNLRTHLKSKYTIQSNTNNLNLLIKKNSKIFVTGHKGLVGNAIVKKLSDLGFKNIITRTSSELDLRNQKKVNNFFRNNKDKLFDTSINAFI